MSVKNVFVLATLLLVGCGSDNQLNPAAAQTASTPAALREAHSGQLTDGGQYDLHLEFSRSGNTLQGVGRVTLEPGLSAIGPLVGTDDGTQHSFTVDLRPRFPKLTFRGRSSSNGFSGTFSPLSGRETRPRLTSGGSYQTQLAAPSAPFQGRYTLSLDDGTTVQLNVTSVKDGDPNLPDVTGLSHGVVAWMGQSSNMQIEDAGGGSYVSGSLGLRLNTFDESLAPFTSCFLTGSASAGRYTYVTLPGGIKNGRYTMRPGF